MARGMGWHAKRTGEALMRLCGIGQNDRRAALYSTNRQSEYNSTSPCFLTRFTRAGCELRVKKKPGETRRAKNALALNPGQV